MQINWEQFSGERLHEALYRRGLDLDSQEMAALDDTPAFMLDIPPRRLTREEIEAIDAKWFGRKPRSWKPTITAEKSATIHCERCGQPYQIDAVRHARAAARVYASCGRVKRSYCSTACAMLANRERRVRHLTYQALPERIVPVAVAEAMFLERFKELTP